MSSFAQFNLDSRIMSAIERIGYKEPTPIQLQAIPVVMKGGDVMGAAQTGTGKTASFGLPLIARILPHANTSMSPARHPVRALILTPTRELADQVSANMTQYAADTPLRVGVVYGGVDIRPQSDMLRRGVEILTATPGRLLDHIEQRATNLSQVEVVVLDEADRMLDMGFLPDISRILKLLPANRQSLMFSATFSPDIARLAKNFLKPDPFMIEVARQNQTADTVTQEVFQVADREKTDVLIDILKTRGPENKPLEQVIVFVNAKITCRRLARTLERVGINADAIHGDKTQEERQAALDGFKSGAIHVLVATDVAARGLDIKELPCVINYDVPFSAEDYVHRIGRTGRAGNTGVAMTFITPREFRQLKLIERTVKTKIQRRQLPTAANVIERQRDQIISKMQTVLELNAYHDYMPIAESLLDDYSAEEVAAAALKLMQEGIKALEAPQEDILSKDLRNTGGRPGMVRLFINIGRSQKIMVKDIVSTIAIEADIPARDIGLINIYDKFTFVEVPEDVAEKVIGAMNKNFIKGYKVNIEPAKARR